MLSALKWVNPAVGGQRQDFFYNSKKKVLYFKLMG